MAKNSKDRNFSPRGQRRLGAYQALMIAELLNKGHTLYETAYATQSSMAAVSQMRSGKSNTWIWKLSFRDYMGIRDKINNGMRHTFIAVQYDVSVSAINRIANDDMDQVNNLISQTNARLPKAVGTKRPAIENSLKLGNTVSEVAREHGVSYQEVRRIEQALARGE